MLDALRKGTGSWIVKILLGLLIASFAVWGIGSDTFSGLGQSSVAIVGETEISPEEFFEEFQRETRRLTARFGGQLDSEQARQFGLDQITLQRLISRALYDEAVRDFGLYVPDAIVAGEIRKNPAFADQTGQFDKFQYEGVLRNNGMSPAYFEFQTRKDMLRRQLLDAITGGATAPRVMAEALYKYRNEIRVAKIAVITNSSMPNISVANDTELIKYHEDNKARYTAPEYRSLTWAVLSPEDISADIMISDKEIKEEYVIRLDEFQTPEKRDVEQLLFDRDDLAGAKAAAGKLAIGGDFLALDQAKYLSLGTQIKTDLPEEAQAAVFALPEGSISAPVETIFGWHLYRVTNIRPGSTKPLAAAATEIKNQIQLRQAAEDLYQLSGKIEDELAGGASLADAAARFNLKVRTVASVDEKGLDEQEKPIDLPQISEFLTTAFQTEVGVEPILNESQEGSYFLIQVNNIMPPTLKPFANVREIVTADWTAEQRSKAAAILAAEMVEAVKGGGDFKAIAGTEGIELKTTKSLTRFSAEGQENISQDLLRKLFDSDVTGAVHAPNRNDSAHVVARLVSIEIARPASNPDAINKLAAELKGESADDLLAQFQTALQNDYEVKIYPDVIETLF